MLSLRAPGLFGGRRKYLIGVAAVVLAFFVARIPEAGQPGLDESWQLVLTRAHEMGLRFGRDLIFSYGPWGFLENEVQLGPWFWPQIIWQVCTRLAAVTLLAVWLNRNARPVTAFIAAMAFASFTPRHAVPPLIDAYFLFVIWLAAGTLGQEEARPHWAVRVLAYLLLAEESQVKLTATVGALAAVGVVVLWHCYHRRWRYAAETVVGCVASYLLFWVSAGQRLTDLGTYLSASLQYVAGYSAAMKLPWDGAVSRGEIGLIAAWSIAFAVCAALPVRQFRFRPHLLGLLCLGAGAFLIARPHAFVSPAGRYTLAAVAGLMLLLWVIRARPRTEPVLAGVTALLGLMAWRHATTRMDEAHLYGFFMLALICVVVWPAAPRTDRLLAGSGIAVAWLACFSFAAVTRQRVTVLRDAAVQHMQLAVAPGLFRDRWRQEEDRLRQAAQLPAIRAAIGGGWVDVQGSQQADAILAGLPYRSRPIPQSYSVFDSHYGETNLDWFQRNRPPFVLMSVASIDGRLPGGDDAPILARMLSGYVLCAEERGFVLMSAIKPNLGPLIFGVASVLRLSSTDWTSVRFSAAREFFARIEFDSPTGKRSDRHPDAVWLEFKRASGEVVTARMPGTMAQAGFVLNPLLERNADLVAWLKAPRGFDRVTAIRIAAQSESVGVDYQVNLKVQRIGEP